MDGHGLKTLKVLWSFCNFYNLIEIKGYTHDNYEELLGFLIINQL